MNSVFKKRWPRLRSVCMDAEPDLEHCQALRFYKLVFPSIRTHLSGMIYIDCYPQ